MRHSMTAGAVVVLAVGSALGQWTSDHAANTTIADRSGEQVQSKIRATPDGGCVIVWFDNSAGGYDVYAQRLDAQGNALWPHNGVLVRDRSVSSTQDYDARWMPRAT